MKCVFCEPEIEQGVFFSSANFMAVYDIAPVLPGHALVIPKRHIESLLELTLDEQTELMHFCTRTLKILLRAYQTEAFDLGLQEKAAAGQTIPHLHIHLLPRQHGDLPQPGDWYSRLYGGTAAIDSQHRNRLSPEQLAEQVSHIRDCMRNSD